MLYAVRVSLSGGIRATLWFGTAALGYWAFVAGRRGGFVCWRMVMVVIVGLLIGVVILLIQVFLQPVEPSPAELQWPELGLANQYANRLFGF
jgi:hypothetical protein